MRLPLQRNAKQPFCHFCLLAEDKFWLSLLFTNRKINIGMDMGENFFTTKVFLAFSYCNLFFKMRKKILSTSPTLPREYRLVSPTWLTNQMTWLAKIFHSSRIKLFILQLWYRINTNSVTVCFITLYCQWHITLSDMKSL